MASTYTSNSGVEKPGIGDQSGEWGTTVNTNMDILDRAINGVGVITLSGTTHTLTTTDGALSDGQYKVLVLSGSPSGTNTITISPNDQDKLYFVVNSSGQTATFSQGSGANVSVVNGDTKIIYADGAGSGAAVTEFASEVDALEGITAGTVSASKAVIVDANKDITGFRNVTLTGELDAGSLDVSGNADIDGTLEADAMTLNGTAITTTATLSTGISNTNVPVFTTGVADDDFLRVAGTSIEGRSASEVLSDIGGQASLTFGISNTNAVKVDSASVADDEYARFTANGLESRSTAEVLSDIGASPVAGSSSIVTTGALDAGSITSGFGTINNGSSAITTTGVITGGTVEATTDTAAGDNAAIGYTAAEGLILTGQGSTSDVTIKNDADATVLSIATGTTKVGVGTTGNLTGYVNLPESDYGEGFNWFSSGTEGNRGGIGHYAYESRIYYGSSDNLTFVDGGPSGTERMRIAADGKVGIGTSAPDSLVEISSGGATTAKVATTVSNSYAEIIFEDGNAGYGFQVRSDGAASLATGSMVINDRDSSSFPVVINEGCGTNTLALSSSSVRVGANEVRASEKFFVKQTAAANAVGIQTTGSDYSNMITFYAANNNVKGSIGATPTAVAYNTSSDYRLKENIDYSWDATTRLKQLKPARFNFISDASNTLVDGFLAHEVSSIVPEAISGTKDAVDSNGDAIYQGIDQSKLVPLLVKTIQELEARITALEAG